MNKIGEEIPHPISMHKTPFLIRGSSQLGHSIIIMTLYSLNIINGYRYQPSNFPS